MFAKDDLIVIGSGGRPFREYALESMGAACSVTLFDRASPTWQKPYIDDHREIDFEDEDALFALVSDRAPRGILTYDESLVEPVARVVARAGLPGASAESIRLCKDKSLLRERLSRAGAGPVAHSVVHTEEEALEAARGIGYPVVVKPRALGGSIGVVRADDDESLTAAFRTAHGASSTEGIVSKHAGVLLEEYLDGPEYSVDCAVWGGVAHPVVVAEKILGTPPYFEEIGHVVPARTSPELDEAVQAVVRAHRIAGLDELVTHTEVRLTEYGPRIIEINVRLGGGLIPHLGRLATGVDLAAAAADIAVGRTPDLETTRERCAAIRMFYPPRAMTVEEVVLARAESDYPGLERFVVFVVPGTRLALPPDGFLSRVGFAITEGDDRQECLDRMEAVASDVTVLGK